ncbi:hypothetical protein AVEN_224744-1 [Araneus ventricosus]|uniref:Uncharacterized protein n=1 Tax=Araneus ventricosus TaxID=182803 RepID=A0A4Y2HWZ7_ARAVE|nr:hypothetical protein AVEN_224744-1 [Araneus ventricosus]
MVGGDITIRNCFRLGGFMRTKQEDDSDFIEYSADHSEEDYEAWINVESNMGKAEKLQKKQNVKHGMNGRHDLRGHEGNSDADGSEEKQPKKLCKPSYFKICPIPCSNLLMSIIHINGLSKECFKKRDPFR